MTHFRENSHKVHRSLQHQNDEKRDGLVCKLDSMTALSKPVKYYKGRLALTFAA